LYVPFLNVFPAAYAQKQALLRGSASYQLQVP